jgi:hypothetical protein
MTEPVAPKLPCGHAKARACRIRRGPRIVLVCRSCRRWFTDRPKPRRVPDLPAFVTADRLMGKP